MVAVLSGGGKIWAEDTASAASPATIAAGQPYLLQMIRDDSVHRELRLSEEQIESVYEAIAEVDPQWWVSRIMPPAKQRVEIMALKGLLRGQLGTILDESQLQRLVELERQAHGTRLARRDDVIKALKVTSNQREQFEDLFAKTDSDVAKLQEQVKDQSIESAAAAARSAEIQQSERDGVVKILTREQQAGIGGLVGKSFNFAGVQRTYPRAPEFVTEGSTWLMPGGNLASSGQENASVPSMKDLRGKVVAVYFYAFQCINCQRNFPHYKGWHEDLADEGLVVIGIQTPETSAERSLTRVETAMQKDGFEYPVLFDEKSNNWRAWANTMWPTTYLIDKKGFVRRWWQGEMNWKGTPGEQQMRESIRQLLAEDSL